MAQSFFVYILASRSRRLYVGVTRDLVRRIHEHRTKVVDGFTARYHIDRLVHFEETSYLQAAIAREKEIKGWRREKKLALVEASNPTWDDLGREWYDGTGTADPSLGMRRSIG